MTTTLTPPKKRTKRAATALQPTGRMPARTKQATPQTKPSSTLPADTTRNGDGATIRAMQPKHPVSPTILRIRELQAMRKAAIRSQIRLINASGAYVRRALGWSKDHPDASKIVKRAADMVGEIENGQPGNESQIGTAADGSDCPAEPYGARAAVTPFVLAHQSARAPLDALRDQCEKDMKAIVRTVATPAFWAWVDSVRGLGDMSVATIIGEAGDLSNYANPAKLWKRFGLAVYSGVAQGKSIDGMTAQDWVERGYSPSRRSIMFVVGDVMVKSNREGVYRKLYDDRKAYEVARDPEMTKMKAHRRAQRYMEKRLLRDMWAEWNRPSLQ